MTKVSVHGVCEHGFEELQNLFSWHLESGKDENAQLCVYVDGACVVDLWGSSTTGNFTYGPDLLHVSNFILMLCNVMSLIIEYYTHLNYALPTYLYISHKSHTLIFLR